MNICPYTEEKCKSNDCTKCKIYFESEYGCDGKCSKCEDSDFCDHLGKRD
ncbi:MAG: hypothetical protein IKO36_05055 [Bacteroidaceae bacterium]|nr:hypothetical protein [Bacteroidaceae bacterium]